MLNKVVAFFIPPEYDTIEQTQRARFLHYALFVSAGACLLLGLLNLTGKTFLDSVLFVVAAISLVCVPANQRGYYYPVAGFISALLIGVTTYSLIAGVGLKDAGLIAYPLFILISSYLFSKRAVFYLTLLSVASVVFVYFLYQNGYVTLAKYSDKEQLQVIVVLLPAAGFLLWAVMDNWEKTMKNLKDTYDLTLSGWGQALEFRDRETEGHSERVVEMTVALARRLGMSRQKLDHIRRGALLHDIGKMAIPDAVLLKKDSLSDEEWKLIQKHPTYAKTLLENIPYLKQAVEIPFSHHERWDGSGYPQGLAEQSIPYAARIFAVVDVWDALTSDRPYRPAWPEEKALEYIREQAGKKFDPYVVQAFLEFIETNKKRRKKGKVFDRGKVEVPPGRNSDRSALQTSRL